MFLTPYRLVNPMGGIGNIPLSEIKNFSQIFNLIIPVDEFSKIIHEMDAIYLEDYSERHGKNNEEVES